MILLGLVCIGFLLAVWLASNTSRTRAQLAALTARVYFLEEELKKLRPVPAVSVQVLPEIEPPPAAVVAAAPPLRRLLNLEERLGTNWLNKLGIIILVIGLALFLAYQLRELGPPGKVTAGYLVSALMLGAGVYFERRELWRVLARTGIAGGWALVYFTTYAMYHVPAAHVLASEALDLVLLLIVAAAMVAHTLRYHSQVVTGIAFLLAFATVNISRGNAHSLIASAILAAGLAAIATRRRWFEMEVMGIAAAFFNHYLWLRVIIEPMHGHIHMFPEYAASTALLVAYWLIFRASYVFRRTENRWEEQVSTIAALLNPALLLSLMVYQSVHPELAFRFLLMVGAAELALGQLPVTRRRRAACVVLTTVGSCLLVAAFTKRYADVNLSAIWLAEAEALLLAGVFLREILFRRLGMLTALLVWMQMIGADAGQVYFERMYHVRMGGRPGLALFFGLTAAVFYANSEWIPRHWPDVVPTERESLFFRRMSLLAGVLGLLGAWIAWPGVWTVVAWAALGVVLLEAGLMCRSSHLRLQAYAAFAVSFLRLFCINLNAEGAGGIFSPRVYTTLPLALAFYYAYYRLTIERRTRAAGWHSFGGMLTLAALIRCELDKDLVVVAWAAMALILVALAWKSGDRVFLRQGLLLGFAVLVRGLLHNLQERGRLFTVGTSATLLFLALPFAFRLRRKGESISGPWYRQLLPAMDRRPEQVFFFIPFLLLTAMLAREVRAGMVTLVWGLEAVAVFLFALEVKERSYRLSGLGLLLVCVVKIIFHDVWGLAPRDRYLTFIVLGAALLAVSYLYTRYRDVLRQYL